MTQQPKLTIGMATYDDFDGVWMTIQSIRLYHREALDDVEFVVVDNHPDRPHGEAVENFLKWLPEGQRRYVPFDEATGTAAPRNRVFAEARGEAVLCVDSHVLIEPHAIERLVEFYDASPGTEDLYQGPIYYDHLQTDDMPTHFNDEWRANMWGTWGIDKRATDADAEPFEIQMQGLGLFTCRKDAWLGFHPGFRGFGGEEGYIHEKFRAHGHHCWCLPFLRWAHRFDNPKGTNYPRPLSDVIRNYFIGHLELNLPVIRVYEHFLEQDVSKADIDMHYQEALDLLSQGAA